MNQVLLAFLSLFASSALAAPSTYVWAEGRFAVHSSQLVSTTTADLSVSLRSDLPFGSTVRVRYGFGQTGSDWQNQHEVEASAVAPWEWRAHFTETLHERGWERAYTKLNFVFIVTTPDGNVHYEKGNDSVWGFYEATLPEPGTIDNDNAHVYQRLVVYSVQRN